MGDLLKQAFQLLSLLGDAHASERIGPSCSRSQIAISVAQLVAALKGASLDNVNMIQEAASPMIKRYHGRQVLFDWMKLQIQEAVYINTDVTPYPEYIKMLIALGKFELQESRQHTRMYLMSYNKGQASPPVHYYRKVSKKDKVQEILKPKELAIINKIID